MKKYRAWLCKTLSIAVSVMLVCPLLNAAVTDSWKSKDFGGSPGEFASVIFLDANTLVGGTPGYYYLNEGALYLSTDGGATWSKKMEGKANISKVRSAAGTQTVYAVGGAEGYGSEGFLGKSTDGGSSWTDLSETFFEARKAALKLDTAYAFPLYGLSVLDANTLFIAGGYSSGNPEVWVSTDGGVSWASAGTIRLDWTSGSETGYLSYGTMQFVSKTAGFAASDNNFFRTTDGGATWEKLSAPWSRKINDGNNLGSVTFLSAEAGWAFVYDNTLSSSSPTYGAEIYKTDNGGASWTLVYKWSFTSSQNEDSPVAFYTGNGAEMWAGSWHKIWRSTDSGTSWTVDYSNPADGYVCVRSFKPAGNDPVPRAMYSIGMTGSYISGYYTRGGGSPVTSTTTTTAGGTSDLMSLGAWDIYGSASVTGTGLQFGDFIGYDPQDTDSDGNPENTWTTGSPGGNQGTDYDWAVSKQAFYPPLTLTWSGCFPATSSGYNSALLAARNAAFTGQPGSGQTIIDWNRVCGFHTNWQNTGKLLSYTKTYSGQAQLIPLTGVTPGTNGDFCGDFKVVWDENLVSYYYNGQLVDQKSFELYEPVYVFFRSFERPFTVSAITVTSGGGPATTTTTSIGGETTTIPYNSSSTTSSIGGETTTTIKPTTTTTANGGQCPAKTVMGQDNPDLKTLRAFRNEIFMQSAAGRRYTTLYYKHAFELANIFSHDQTLREKAGNLIQKLMPALGNLLVKKEAAIGEGTVQQALELIDALTAQANPALVKDLQQLKQNIQNGGLFNTVKVKIQK